MESAHKNKRFQFKGIQFEIKRTFQKSKGSNNTNSTLTTDFETTQTKGLAMKGKKDQVWVKAPPSPHPLTQKSQEQKWGP